MGFNYLDGKNWDEITRDERFFCQRLFQLINAETAGSFVEYLCHEHDLNVSAVGEWEAGYEVCFYRDLWHSQRSKGKLFSPKRTFDLCLFGEKAIVIIEAKAAGEFELGQNQSFIRDFKEVKALTGVDTVQLVGLCSSMYHPTPKQSEPFTGPILRWSDLARRYGEDPILQRADAVYKKSKPFSSFGRHSTVKLSGKELLGAYTGGAGWWIGRGGGGFDGERFQEDLSTGRWETQNYEVNTQASEPPSPNYFSLKEFVLAVEERGDNKE